MLVFYVFFHSSGKLLYKDNEVGRVLGWKKCLSKVYDRLDFKLLYILLSFGVSASITHFFENHCLGMNSAVFTDIEGRLCEVVFEVPGCYGCCCWGPG